MARGGRLGRHDRVVTYGFRELSVCNVARRRDCDAPCALLMNISIIANRICDLTDVTAVSQPDRLTKVAGDARGKTGSGRVGFMT